jgi:hypothetical protein
MPNCSDFLETLFVQFLDGMAYQGGPKLGFIEDYYVGILFLDDERLYSFVYKAVKEILRCLRSPLPSDG